MSPRSGFSLTAFVFLLSFQPAFLAAAQKAAVPEPVRITVRVYNYARIESYRLERTQRRVSEILIRAGFEIHWIRCPLCEPSLHHALHVPGKASLLRNSGNCILEDEVLAERWGEGRISIDGLLAYSEVCGTGLDTVPLPGDVSEEQLARIIGDMATLAFKWNKPLTARLMPAKGKKPGDRTEFQGRMLVNTIVQPLP